MRILYYSVVFNSKHGGSNHARQFIKYASAHPEVDEILLFPKPRIKNKFEKAKKQSWLKKSRVFLIPRFYRRNTHLIDELISFIEVEKPEVLIMRPDHNFLQLKKLRKHFPDMLLVAEINSSSFDESYIKIPFKRYFQNLERSTYSLSDLNCFVTKELCRQVMGGEYKSGRDLVIYNGTEPDKFGGKQAEVNYRGELGISEESLTIGYMGTLDSHKKMHLLIDAFSRLIPNQPHLLLLIVGDGPDLELIEQQIEALGLRSHVRITGWVDYERIERYLFAMDVAIHHHSNSYCCPLKIFDYMAAGLPTIGPDIPFIREQFVDGVHLAVTKPNVEDITDSILSFLENRDWAKEVGNRGREYVNSNFTWEKSAHQIIDQIVLKLDENCKSGISK